MLDPEAAALLLCTGRKLHEGHVPSSSNNSSRGHEPRTSSQPAEGAGSVLALYDDQMSVVRAVSLRCMEASVGCAGLTLMYSCPMCPSHGFEPLCSLCLCRGYCSLWTWQGLEGDANGSTP